MHAILPWLILASLGAFHGLNPAMGWLFAVAVGLQERSRPAVIRALGTIAAGHAASVAIVVALVASLGVLVPVMDLKIAGGVVLILFGLYKLRSPMSHPRWIGMRVTRRDLMVWSFLMATAHGAGLMLVPVLTSIPASRVTSDSHAGHMAMSMTIPTLPAPDVVIVAVHTAAMLGVMGAIALIVFDRLGLRVLREAWFNLDRVWAGILIAAGVITLAV